MSLRIWQRYPTRTRLRIRTIEIERELTGMDIIHEEKNFNWNPESEINWQTFGMSLVGESLLSFSNQSHLGKNVEFST